MGHLRYEPTHGLRVMRKQAGKPPPAKSGGQVAFVVPVKGTHWHSGASWLSQVNLHGYHGQVECIWVVLAPRGGRCAPAHLLQARSQASLPPGASRRSHAGDLVRHSERVLSFPGTANTR